MLFSVSDLNLPLYFLSYRLCLAVLGEDIGCIRMDTRSPQWPVGSDSVTGNQIWNTASFIAKCSYQRRWLCTRQPVIIIASTKQNRNTKSENNQIVFTHERTLSCFASAAVHVGGRQNPVALCAESCYILNVKK